MYRLTMTVRRCPVWHMMSRSSVLKMVEPPCQTCIRSHIKSDVRVTYLYRWGGSSSGELPPDGDVDLLEGAADEE
jgi:hypothetical protein